MSIFFGGGSRDEDCIDWKAWYEARKNMVTTRILNQVAKEMEQGRLLLEVTLNREDSKEWREFAKHVARYDLPDSDGHNYLYTQAGKTRIILTDE